MIVDKIIKEIDNLKEDQRSIVIKHILEKYLKDAIIIDDSSGLWGKEDDTYD